MPRKPKPPKKPRGIREDTLADGTTRYKALIKVKGKQKSLGTYDTFDEAVAVRHAHFERLAEKAKETGAQVRMDPGILTVAQMGYMCLAGRDKDIDRWRYRVVEMAEFSGFPATQVDEHMVATWIAQMAATPIKSGKNAGEIPTRPTIAWALSILHRVYRWGIMPTRRYVTHNPAKNVKISECTEVKLKTNRNILDYLREDEARKVLEAKPEQLPLEAKAKFVMLMVAGARPRDVWHVRWECVDWLAETIQFTSTKTSEGEGSTDYLVHPLPQLLTVLKQWWLACGRPTKGLIFPAGKNRDGTERVYGRDYDAGWQDKKERRTRVWWVDNTEDGSLSADSTRPKKASVNGHQAKRLRRLYGERRTSKGELKVTPGWRSKLGIKRDVPLYALRHTCACHLLLGTELFTGGREWSREEVQSQLGHQDSEATEHYMLALGVLARRAAKESKAALAMAKARAKGAEG